MNETVQVHGLDGTLVAPDWPVLTLAELRELFESFPDAGKPIEIVFTSPRPLSAAAVVNTVRGTFFIKRHSRLVRDREGLLEEHRFMAHLLSQGASVPKILLSKESGSVVEKGEWTYEVHESADGIDIYRDAISWTPFFCAAHARESGRALARMHLAASGFDAPKRKPQPLVASFSIFAAAGASLAMKDYLDARRTLANHPELRRCANEAYEVLSPFHAELLPLLPYLAPLWTHNDLHASNLLWNGSGETARATTVIDFGLADKTNAVHDLANAIERNIVEWLVHSRSPGEPDEVPVHFDHLEALLTGYEAVRPLSRQEAAALAPMTALCHAEFALSEADYFLDVLKSEDSARRAYDGYLVGHSRWFHSARGKALLDAIRRWAESRVRKIRL